MPQFVSRTDGLDVHEVPDGFIVYQDTADNVCYLNNTAAVVFEFCDGKRDPADIIGRVAKIYDLPASRHGEIQDCMDQLIAKGLVRLTPS